MAFHEFAAAMLPAAGAGRGRDGRQATAAEGVFLQGSDAEDNFGGRRLDDCLLAE